MKLNDLAEKIKIKIEINKKMDRLRRYIIKRNENKEKYYLPLSFVNDVENKLKKYPALTQIYLGQLDYVPKIDGKLPRQAGKALEQLFSNENLVVGRHIGGLTANQMKDINFSFRYESNDITSTVMFNKSLSTGIDTFLLSDFVYHCHSDKVINSYKNGRSVTIFAFPKEIFKDSSLPIWYHNQLDNMYYLVPQFILGSFSYDYEKKEIVFVQNPNFNPNAKYKTEGLEYDESQNQVTKVNSRAL